MVRLVFYAILLILLARAMARFWRGLAEGMSGTPNPGGGVPQRGVDMVRDPVCGTFVVRDRAVTLMIGHEHHYFCSVSCRDTYRTKTA
jgi:uncharacterized protein